MEFATPFTSYVADEVSYLMLEAAVLPPAPVTPGHRNPLHIGLPLRLRKARRASGLSTRAVGRGAGLTHGTISHIEGGAVSVGADTVEKLARVLGVSPCWLAFGIEGDRVFRQKVPGGASAPGTAPPPATDPTPGPLACTGLAARLIAARGEELSRLALAKASGISHTTIGHIETGRAAGVDVVEALAVALEVSPCWLAYGVGQGPQE